jgi:hypothetical protein
MRARWVGVAADVAIAMGTLAAWAAPDVSRLVEVAHPLSGDNPAYALPAAPAPAPGAAVFDSRFGTGSARVTQTFGVRHEYSRVDPFNRDQSMIVLHNVTAGNYGVYRTSSLPYDAPQNLAMTVEAAEPRWDPGDDAILWGLDGLSIVRIHVASGQVATVKDFSRDPRIGPIVAAEPDLYRVTRQDEGEASADFRYWAFMLQGTSQEYRVRYLFCWDRAADEVTGVYTVGVREAALDWVGMSPAGHWVLIGGDIDNGPTLTGLTLANREFTRFHQLDAATGHADVGFDSEGREVIVMQNALTDFVDLIPIDPATRPVPPDTLSYSNTNRRALMRLFYASQATNGFYGGVHVSCNAPGWCVVSTTHVPGTPDVNWLERTLTLVRLDRAAPRVFCLAKIHGENGTYWDETHGTITRDGRKVVWTTNWGQNVGQDPARVWDMVLGVPTEGDLWSAAVDLGSGWRRLEWFGTFNAGASPWIYHATHGWMCPVGTSTAGLWLYALDLGWLWTGETVYPWLYDLNLATWLYYHRHSSAPRWFFNSQTREWQTL